MGYATLDAALAFKDNIPPPQAHIVLSDSLQASANFLLHHFIVNHLKANRKVVLVGLSQIFNHYFLIGRKLGVNLQASKQSGQFVFLDALTHLNSYTKRTPYPPERVPSAPTAVLDGSCSSDALPSFLSTIQSHLSENALLILDDTSVLLDTGFDASSIYDFIYTLKHTLAEKQGTLISVVHADESGVEDVDQDAFVRTMLHSADLVLQVQALQSGFARDVHGQLCILPGPQHIPDDTIPPAQALHYKILDNTAEFFARGVSRGVL
ncbi:hypothetical protein BCR43DRAFT_473816 [Syncephalastrum racemosum]|uniref:Elongator complex protein 6 n=1 Tax=Syncephalastrum racemosum TaxID=13706 RepID=A0A1X2HBK4_SYNRA|nr:hypothetical protein BCR43DRAFT_473816 [Syncephalastrum racemosum]